MINDNKTVTYRASHCSASSHRVMWEDPLRGDCFPGARRYPESLVHYSNPPQDRKFPFFYKSWYFMTQLNKLKSPKRCFLVLLQHTLIIPDTQHVQIAFLPPILMFLVTEKLFCRERVFFFKRELSLPTLQHNKVKIPRS